MIPLTTLAILNHVWGQYNFWHSHFTVLNICTFLVISNSPSLQRQKHLHLAVEVYVEVYEISLANCLDLV